MATKKDAAVMPTGGPQDGALPEGVAEELAAAQTRAEEHERAQTASTPSLVGVKIAGRDFQLPTDVADAMQEREREFQQKLSEHSNELGQLRQWRTQVQQTVQPQSQPQGPDLNTIWFTDPAKAAALVEERTTQKLAQAYQRDMTIRTFWDTYHRKYPDYTDASVLSESLFSRHVQELNAMPNLDAAADRLGDLVGKEILKLTRKVKTDENPRQPARLVERATGERVAPPSEEDEEDKKLPKSLGEAIRARQRARAGGRRSA
jgi:hypothetical protein